MRRAIQVLTALVVACLSAPAVGSERTCENWVARVVSVQGDVEIRRADAAVWSLARLEDYLCAGDIIRVMERSRAAIVLPNDAVVRLDQQTTVSLTPPEPEPAYLLKLIQGAVHFFSRVPRTLRILTPFVNGTIEGTEVAIASTDTESTVTVLEGRFRIENDRGSLLLASGNSARVRQDVAPAVDPTVAPLEQIRWTLYYPPVFGLGTGAFADTADTDLEKRMATASAAFAAGNTADAFSQLAVDDSTVREPAFFALRASLLLFVGRVEAAAADIARLRDLNPGGGEADAIEAVMAASQNQKAEALDLAAAAVSKSPRSAAAHIALSYARQAAFDLDGAAQALEAAVALEPDNGLAWARLAEIQLARGEVRAAGASADRAASLLPDLSRVQVVRGFTLLTRIRIDEALAAFNQAVEQNSAAPLPRLGLGLAQIRKGSLRPGRQNIEIAAALDPLNSLLRSYLGKAYYDEKRDDDAAHQYELAKQYDPADPTPWFYDAIRKQTENRPVEALGDIQEAIDRNDNRAVYRSRFLLDQDLAARSAALGRLYSDLGFEQLALVEGFKSVNTAPSNYSAHRLLADVYSAKPRHEKARVSELLQSQLLQPLNVTPLQPQLAISDLLIIQGSGPSDLSFNEFNPLFLRNRATLQASGVVGENDTIGEEVVYAGLYNNLSYSFGQFYYETDGFRDNNEQRQNIYNGFVQFALDHSTSFQGEFRSRDVNSGDLENLFDPDNFSSTIEKDLDVDIFRAGFHHSFGPGNDVIASFVTGQVDEDQEDPFSLSIPLPPLGTIETSGENRIMEETRGHAIEAQHLFDCGFLRLTTGGGYFWGDADQTVSTDSETFLPFPPFFTTSSSTTAEDSEIRQWDIYSYAQLDLTDNFTLVAGLSYDDFDNDRKTRDQVNPKLGVLYSPWQDTTIRLAGFRYLSRNLIADQTIEPTQVAGFNQLFDDKPGTESWAAGIAVDQKLTDHLFSGVELMGRWLEVPFSEFSGILPRENKTANWRERTARAYLYWTPHPWISTKAEYLLEVFDNREDFPGTDRFNTLTTHRVTLGGGIYHPSGAFSSLKTTYVDQSGEFIGQLTGPSLEVGDDDQFWVVDAAVGYRLPKRYGILSFEVLNLFDETFHFQDTDPANPNITPERTALFKLTLSF